MEHILNETAKVEQMAYNISHIIDFHFPLNSFDLGKKGQDPTSFPAVYLILMYIYLVC